MSRYESLISLLRKIDAGKALPTPNVKPIRAYHGSPHSFNAFDPDAIGSGTGRNIHGTGFYFSTEPGVASRYRGPQLDNAGTITGGQLGPTFLEADEIGLIMPETLEEMGVESLGKTEDLNYRAEFRNLIDHINHQQQNIKGLGEEGFSKSVNDYVNQRLNQLEQDPSSVPLIHGTKATTDDPALIANRMDALKRIQKSVSQPGGAEMQMVPYLGETREADLYLDTGSEVVHGVRDPKDMSRFRPDTGDETMAKLYKYYEDTVGDGDVGPLPGTEEYENLTGIEKQIAEEDAKLMSMEERLEPFKAALDARGNTIDPVTLERSLRKHAAESAMGEVSFMREIMDGRKSSPKELLPYYKGPTFEKLIGQHTARVLDEAGIKGYKTSRLGSGGDVKKVGDDIIVMNPNATNRIRTLRRYAVPGAVGAGAAAAGSNQEAEAARPTSMRSLMNLISSSPTGRSLSVLPPSAFNTPRGQNLLQGLSPEQIEELAKQGGGYFDITDPKSPTLLPNFSNFDRAAVSTQGRFPEFRADLPGTISDLPRDIHGRVPRGTGKQIYTNLAKPTTGIKIDGARPDNSVISTLAGNNHYYSNLLDIDAPGVLDTFGIRNPGKEQPVNKPMAQGELYGGKPIAELSMRGKSHPFYDRLGIIPPGGEPPEGMTRLAGVPAPVMFAAADGKKGNIVEASVNNISRVADPIDRSTALVEELQDKVQAPVSTGAEDRQYGEQEAKYRSNVSDFISTTPLSNDYLNEAVKALASVHGEEGMVQTLQHFVDTYSEDGQTITGLPIEAGVLINNILSQEPGSFDLDSAISLTQEGRDNLSPEYLGVVGHISQQHFDGDYSLPSFRTEEEANAIAERTGENPDYYMNDNAYKNHQYLRGVDLASAGNKDLFYSMEGSSRPQFMQDAPRAVGFGGMSNMMPAQIPIADADEPEARFGYANELYERSNIPSTLNPDHRSIYDLKGRPRFNRYATDNLGNIIDSAYGSQRNMNSYGRLTSGGESLFRPLEISRIAQETGMPVDRIREINAFLRKSQDRGPTGRMPEGLTQEEYAKMIREFKAGQDQSDKEFGQVFANALSDGTHAVLNKNPLIEFTTGEPFDLGDKKDMRIAATGFQKSVPKAVEGVGADPATYAFAGLGGLAGAASKGATLGARLGKIGEGAAIGAVGSEDVIFEGGIPAIGGALTEGSTYFTGDASAIDPVTGVKPSDPSYEQKREENERNRTTAQGKQMNILNDLLPEKKRGTVLPKELTPRTKAGGFQVPAFI